MTKAKDVTLSSDQRGFIPWVKATEACYSRGEPSSGAECTSSGMSSSSSSPPSGFPFSWGCAAASAVAVGCSVTTGCWRGFNSSSPPYKGCPKQDLCFSNGRNGCSTISPFLHALILDPPEAFMGNSFTTYGGCSPCFSLSHSDLVHPYCDFFLLGPTDFLPQEFGWSSKSLFRETR
jgi:hypothetical protein